MTDPHQTPANRPRVEFQQRGVLTSGATEHADIEEAVAEAEAEAVVEAIDEAIVEAEVEAVAEAIEETVEELAEAVVEGAVAAELLEELIDSDLSGPEVEATEVEPGRDRGRGGGLPRSSSRRSKPGRRGRGRGGGRGRAGRPSSKKPSSRPVGGGRRSRPSSRPRSKRPSRPRPRWPAPSILSDAVDAVARGPRPGTPCWPRPPTPGRERTSRPGQWFVVHTQSGATRRRSKQNLEARISST